MKGKRLVIIFSSLAVVILAAVLWPGEREPEYNGVPLSSWLERGDRGLWVIEFPNAIKHMGTNALPALVRSVDYRPARWRVWLRFRIVPRLPTTIQNARFIQWLLEDKAARRLIGAIEAFGYLGHDARPALKDLYRVANRSSRKRLNLAASAIDALLSAEAATDIEQRKLPTR